jgi:diamine N-acetyltransferase
MNLHSDNAYQQAFIIPPSDHRDGEVPFIRWASENDLRTTSFMTAFTIRRAALADAPELAEIAARTFEETFGTSNSPENLQAHLRSCYGVAQQSAEIADPDVITLLAYRIEELIGFAQVRRKPAPSCVVAERPIELHRFYLARSAHGAGAAALLMLAARAAARELGGQHLWLGVWERNPRAVAFYVKSGFTKVGSHDFIVGNDRQTDWVFVSPLSQQATCMSDWVPA